MWDKIKAFAVAASIRALRTMAQTAVSVIGVGAVMADADWTRVWSASALAGVLSLLTSVATGLPEADFPDGGGQSGQIP